MVLMRSRKKETPGTIDEAVRVQIYLLFKVEKTGGGR